MTVLAAAEAPVAAGAAGEGIAGSQAGLSRAGARQARSAPPAAPSAPSRQRQSRPRARKISRTNYQPVILVEFIAAILLTAATPIATKKDTQGLSPYAGADIVKLSAITLVYLILAMISVGGRSWGRVAAWLGGLILLTDGLYEASNIARDLQVFGGGGASKPAPAAAPAGPPPGGGIVPTPSGRASLQFGVSGG